MIDLQDPTVPQPAPDPTQTPPQPASPALRIG
jgi:hypothetical protein